MRRLKHRVLIKKPVQVTGEELSVLDTYEDYLDTWANIFELTGKTQYSDDGLYAQQLYDIIIRYNEKSKQITSNFIVIHEDRTYVISSPPINRDQESKYLKLRAWEKNAS